MLVYRAGKYPSVCLRRSLHWLVPEIISLEKSKLLLGGNQKVNIRFKSPLQLQLGGQLESVEITWKEWGRRGDPVVYVVPALSASAHIASHPEDQRLGWWEDIVGCEKAICTNTYHVIASNILVNL